MHIIPYLLLLLSICLETGKNVFSNNFSKSVLKNETDIYKFNFLMYTGSFFILLFFCGWKGSLFSVILAFIFALALWLNQYFFLKALKVGSVSFTNFIQCSSLIIPIIFATVVWKDKITFLQIILIAVLIFSLIPTLNIGKERLNIKWLLYSFAAMLALGVIGIIQAFHQSSSHSGELVFFLRHAFLFAVIINLLGFSLCRKREQANFSFKSTALVQAAASGAFMGGVHMLNLYLAGKLPYVVLFPTLNGGLIFLTLICDLFIFKERLSLKQWIGIIIGTLALCLIDL